MQYILNLKGGVGNAIHIIILRSSGPIELNLRLRISSGDKRFAVYVIREAEHFGKRILFIFLAAENDIFEKYYHFSATAGSNPFLTYGYPPMTSRDGGNGGHQVQSPAQVTTYGSPQAPVQQNQISYGAPVSPVQNTYQPVYSQPQQVYAQPQTSYGQQPQTGYGQQSQTGYAQPVSTGYGQQAPQHYRDEEEPELWERLFPVSLPWHYSYVY
jgi:hypothetical protein